LRKNQRDANLIAWAAVTYDVNLGSDEPVDSIAAIRADQFRERRAKVFAEPWKARLFLERAGSGSSIP